MAIVKRPPPWRFLRAKPLPPDVYRGRGKHRKVFPFIRAEYFQTYQQGFRIEDTSLALFELYVGVNGPTDFSAPVATSATLPFSWTPTLPSSGTATYNLVVRQRNRYNLLSFNVYEQIVEFVSHVATLGPLTVPYDVEVYDDATGYVRVISKYLSVADASPADTWELYVKVGSDPVPGTDTPAYSGAMSFFGPESAVSQALGPYATGAVAHVIASVVRSADGRRASAPVVLHTLRTPLDISQGVLFGGDAFEQE